MQENETQTLITGTEVHEQIVQTDMVNDDFNKEFADCGMQADLITAQKPRIQTYVVEPKAFSDVEVQVDLMVPQQRREVDDFGMQVELGVHGYILQTEAEMLEESK